MGKELTPFNRREQEFFIQLLLLRNDLYSNAESVRERLKDYPGDWRDLHLILKLAEKIQNHLSLTIPPERLLRYKELVNHGKYMLEFPGASPNGHYKLVDVKELSDLGEAAIRGQCSMCMLDGKEIKRCPLRNALLTVATPTQISKYGCEYRKAASDLNANREVSI